MKHVHSDIARQRLYKAMGDCQPYLKGGETPAQCIERNRRDLCAALGMLAEAKKTLEMIADIAHSGGLVKMTPNEALITIRRLTIGNWRTDGSQDNHRASVMSAIAEALERGAAGKTMSKRFGREIRQSKESALELLQEVGIINADGSLSENYRP